MNLPCIQMYSKQKKQDEASVFTSAHEWWFITVESQKITLNKSKVFVLVSHRWVCDWTCFTVSSWRVKLYRILGQKWSWTKKKRKNIMFMAMALPVILLLCILLLITNHDLDYKKHIIIKRQWEKRPKYHKIMIMWKGERSTLQSGLVQMPCLALRQQACPTSDFTHWLWILAAMNRQHEIIMRIIAFFVAREIRTFSPRVNASAVRASWSITRVMEKCDSNE